MLQQDSQVLEEVIPESNEGVWEGTCWDDGTGRNVYYIDKNGKVRNRDCI